MSSVFDILGPVMVGPSSSHTAGAVNIGRVARQILGNEPIRADITLYGSFAMTYRGHGTDRALVAGILGMTTYDSRIKNALEIAEQQNVKINFVLEGQHPYHANTAKIVIYGGDHRAEIIGVSIGGGRISIKEIDGFAVNLSGEYHTLICSYDEQLGMVAQVSAILASENVNIAFMRVSRNENRDRALMIVQVDQPLTEEVVSKLNKLEAIAHVKYLRKIEF
ncbi:MAG: serine dehydratase [Desulfitibacter sp. BRH_c19]|nr:MAG: serine dehydratase [Desulfitibacter sp. BRH_c19]